MRTILCLHFLILQSASFQCPDIFTPMPVTMTSLLLLLAFAASCSVTSGEFSGQINLYRDINYRNNLALFAFTRSNRCFNLACGDYNNAVSSVSWSGLPTSASYDGEKNAHIVFYVDTYCTG